VHDGLERAGRRTVGGGFSGRTGWNLHSATLQYGQIFKRKSVMIFRNEDSQKRLALFFVFGLGALVVVSVLVFGVYKQASFEQAQSAASPAAAPNTAQAASDAASIKVEQGVVKFYFASGKSELAAGASQALADLVKGAQAGRKLSISGFHDANGNPAFNVELAKKRALAVRNVLKAAGVAEGQIEIKKPEPVSSSGSDAEARRVEISLQ
jgi:outer membrane protein OmpA-like peptidoglycan-associated protein